MTEIYNVTKSGIKDDRGIFSLLGYSYIDEVVCSDAAGFVQEIFLALLQKFEYSADVLARSTAGTWKKYLLSVDTGSSSFEFIAVVGAALYEFSEV